MPSFFIAPNQAHITHTQRRELFLGKTILWGDTFHTLDSFIKKCSDPLIAAVSQVVKKALVADIIRKTPLKYFENVKESGSIANEFARAITLLRKNGIGSTSLEKDLSDKGSLKEFDLLTVYKQYEERLKSSGLEDDGNIFTSAINNIKDKKLEFLLEADVIEFAGFDTWTPAREMLQSAIKNTYPDIKISTTEATTNNIAPRTELIKFRSVGCECRFIVKKIVELLSGGHRSEDIGLVLSKSSKIIPELTRSLLDVGLIDACKVTKYDGVIAKIKRSLGSDAALVNIAESLTTSLASGENPHHAAANLTDIDSIFAAEFELNETRNSGIIVENTTEILSDILNSNDHLDQYDLPFTLLFFEDNYVPDLKVIIIPEMAEGVIPIETASSIFFQDKTFSNDDAPDYFKQLFPNIDIVRELETAKFFRFVSAAKDETILTLSEISSQGKEVSQSHVLVQLEPVETDHDYITNPLEKNEMPVIQKKSEKYSADLSPKITSGHIDADHVFSASQLETYAKCPYQYYLKKIARLEPIDPPTPEINPKDRGKIIHRVMELFFKSELANCLRFLRSEIKFNELEGKIDEYITTSVDEHKEELEKTEGSMVDHFKKRSRTIIISAIRKELELILNMQYPLLPAKTEWEFGVHGDNYLVLGNERIEGIIDRIDVDEEHAAFAITDYKTGKTDSILSKIRNGEHLQLPLYIRATKELLYPDKEPVGGFLYTLKTIEKKHGLGKKESREFYFPKLNSRMFVKEAEWQELTDIAMNFASEYMQAIRDQVFPVNTKSCRNKCNYNDICRYGKK